MTFFFTQTLVVSVFCHTPCICAMLVHDWALSFILAAPLFGIPGTMFLCLCVVILRGTLRGRATLAYCSRTYVIVCLQCGSASSNCTQAQLFQCSRWNRQWKKIYESKSVVLFVVVCDVCFLPFAIVSRSSLSMFVSKSSFYYSWASKFVRETMDAESVRAHCTTAHAVWGHGARLSIHAATTLIWRKTARKRHVTEFRVIFENLFFFFR